MAWILAYIAVRNLLSTISMAHLHWRNCPFYPFYPFCPFCHFSLFFSHSSPLSPPSLCGFSPLFRVSYHSKQQNRSWHALLVAQHASKKPVLPNSRQMFSAKSYKKKIRLLAKTFGCTLFLQNG
jgi:hypothetical protein